MYNGKYKATVIKVELVTAVLLAGSDRSLQFQLMCNHAGCPIFWSGPHPPRCVGVENLCHVCALCRHDSSIVFHVPS